MIIRCSKLPWISPCLYQDKGIMQALQMIFGLTHSILCLCLKFSMKLLFKVLVSEHYTKVMLPSLFEIELYKETILQNFPDLYGAWCTMDGLKIPIQAPDNRKMQNALHRIMVFMISWMKFLIVWEVNVSLMQHF
jgi:hypothetical protein